MLWGQIDLNLPVSTKMVLDLVDFIVMSNRNITTNNYYASVPLAKELKNQRLTLVDVVKKNQTCIPLQFL